MQSKCPVCGCPVELSDTKLSMNDAITADISYSLRVETIIKHNGFVDYECGQFMQALAREVRESMVKRLDSWSQDLHSI